MEQSEGDHMTECPRCNSIVSDAAERLCKSCGYDLVGGNTSPLAERNETALADPSSPVPVLIGFRLSGERKEFRLERSEIAIGKAPHNQIILDDSTVSASHAIVNLNSSGYSILDLASRNGTWVNGVRLSNRSHLLRHGDRIQIGQTVLTLRIPEQRQPEESAGGTLPLESIGRSSVTKGSEQEERTITINLPREVRRALTRERAGQPSTPPAAKRSPVHQRRNSRLRATLVNSASRIISTIIGTSLTVALALYLSRQFLPSPVITPVSPASQSAGRSVTLLGGDSWIDLQSGALGVRFEASGAASRPGASGMLLLSDRGTDPLFWMEVNEKGEQKGALQAIPMLVNPGENISDPEALTYGNSYYYLLGSQSDPIDTRQHRLLRFDFDPVTRMIRSRIESIGNLRNIILSNIPEIAANGSRPGSVGGLNAEGLAWDPNHERLLIGLRSPLIGDQALLVPLRLRDQLGPFDQNNLQIDEPRLIILPLDGQGVRDITYDPVLKKFLIISGPVVNGEEDDFNLWEWNGERDSPPRRLLTMDGKRRPEGIASISINDRNLLLITGDTGSFAALRYR